MDNYTNFADDVIEAFYAHCDECQKLGIPHTPFATFRRTYTGTAGDTQAA